MTYWKFLRPGARSPFTDYRWSSGVWAHSAPTRPCAGGFHACRAADLPYWLGEELWRVELGGQVTELDHKVVASEARLVEPVSRWDSATGREFALACARRVVAHAVAELSAHGLDEESELLRAATPTGWAGAAEAGATSADRIAAETALRLCGYVLDAVETLASYPAAASAYLAARVAYERTPPGADGYTTERDWQADWLTARLGLTAQSG